MEYNSNINSKRPQSDLYFDPNDHPDETLKAFDNFTQMFELRYDAQFPDPPKVSLDAAIQRWKVENTVAGQQAPIPTLEQYDDLVSSWRSRDKVAKCLGMFSSNRLFTDWQIAEPNEALRKASTWDNFIEKMQDYYKPTENLTLKNFQFRSLLQDTKESFATFCNRVEKESKHCGFKCENADCTAQNTAIRDQIIIGTSEEKIREEALMKSWDLPTLRREGTKMESAAKGGAAMSGEPLNRLGKYSHRNIRTNLPKPRTPVDCFNCGEGVTISFRQHKRVCTAKDHICENCGKPGHFTSLCKSPKVRQVTPATAKVEPTNHLDSTEQESSTNEPTYNINIFRIEPVEDTHAEQTIPDPSIIDNAPVLQQQLISQSPPTLPPKTQEPILTSKVLPQHLLVMSMKWTLDVWEHQKTRCFHPGNPMYTMTFEHQLWLTTE